MNQVGHKIESALTGGEYLVTSTEPFDRSARVLVKSIELTSLLVGVSTAFAHLASDLKVMIEVFDSWRLPGIVNLLFCKNDKGLYFLQDAKNSWQKCADRVTLFAHVALKSVGAMNKYGFIDLGKIATYSVGYIPVFRLVTDSCYLVSCTFATWDGLNKVEELDKKYAEKQAKVTKWEELPATIAKLQVGDAATVAAFTTKYQAKSAALQQKISTLGEEVGVVKEIIKQVSKAEAPPHITPEQRQVMETKYVAEEKALNKKIGDLQVKQKRYADRVTNLTNKLFVNVAQEIGSPDRVAYKAHKWTVVRDNQSADQTTNWLRVVASATKIVILALAISLTALNAWTVALTITVCGLGLFSDSCALVRIFRDKFPAHEKVPSFNEWQVQQAEAQVKAKEKAIREREAAESVSSNGISWSSYLGFEAAAGAL